jgi:DNA-binding NarL/FixJ family response regulator
VIGVLVVDSSAAVRAHLSAQLAGDGFAVVGEADSLMLAISLARRHAPQAIVVDVLLIDQRGVAVVEALRAAAPDSRIVVMSNAIGYRRTCMASGADAFVDKSIELSDLSTLLRQPRHPRPPASPRS